ERRDLYVERQLDVVLLIETEVVHEDRVELLLAGPQPFRQRRPVVRALRVGTHEQDRAACILLADSFHRRGSGEAATGDDVVVRLLSHDRTPWAGPSYSPFGRSGVSTL